MKIESVRLLGKMVANKATKRTLKDVSNLVIHVFCSIAKQVLIVPSHTSNERNGQIFVLIRLYMIGQEVGKALLNQVLQAGKFQMATNKLRERSQPTVSQRLTINAIDNLRQRQTGFLLKHLHQLLFQNTPIKIVNQTLTQHGSTTLVAYNITQGRGVTNNL